MVVDAVRFEGHYPSPAMSLKSCRKYTSKDCIEVNQPSHATIRRFRGRGLGLDLGGAYDTEGAKAVMVDVASRCARSLKSPIAPIVEGDDLSNSRGNGLYSWKI